MSRLPRQMAMPVFNSTNNLAGHLLWLIYKAQQLPGAANQLPMETLLHHCHGVSPSQILSELEKLEDAGLAFKKGPDLYDLTEAGLREIQRMG